MYDIYSPDFILNFIQMAIEIMFILSIIYLFKEVLKNEENENKKSIDKKRFRRTALDTKKINLSPTIPRGGICL